MLTIYSDQVRLLVSLLPIVARQTCFALKGGTAINLFIRDMPRLSVDIDLAYLPVEDRATSLTGIDTALHQIAEHIKKRHPNAKVNTLLLKGSNTIYKLIVFKDGINVKIEVTAVLRGSVYPPGRCRISPKTEAEFGFADAVLLSFEDLFAGKICAALDRQHPRDLYDIYLLLKNEGINDRLKNAFLVYLMGHSRPMSEMLAPRYQDISPMYKTEFQGMAFEPIQIEQLRDTLPNLINIINGALNNDDRRFLLNFKKGIQDWNKFPVPEAEHLPAVQWKQLNLNRMSRDKHKRAIDKLEKTLYGYRQSDL